MSKYPKKKISQGKPDLWTMAMSTESSVDKSYLQNLMDGLNDEMEKIVKKRKMPKRRESIMLTDSMQKELQTLLNEVKKTKPKVPKIKRVTKPTTSTVELALNTSQPSEANTSIRTDAILPDTFTMSEQFDPVTPFEETYEITQLIDHSLTENGSPILDIFASPISCEMGAKFTPPTLTSTMIDTPFQPCESN